VFYRFTAVKSFDHGKFTAVTENKKGFTAASLPVYK
jgi:hypothetical protein